MTVHEKVHAMLSDEELTEEGTRHLARCKDCREWQDALSRIRLDAQNLFGNDVPWIPDATKWQPTDFKRARYGEQERVPARRRRVTQIVIAASLVAAVAVAVLMIPRSERKPGGFAGATGSGAHFSLTFSTGNGVTAQTASFTGTLIFGRGFSGKYRTTVNGVTAEGRAIVVGGRGWVSAPSYENGATFVTSEYRVPGLLEAVEEYPPALQERTMTKTGEETLDGVRVEHWHAEGAESGNVANGTFESDAWVGVTDHIVRRAKTTIRIALTEGREFSNVSDLRLTDFGDVAPLTAPDDSAKTIDAATFTRDAQDALDRFDDGSTPEARQAIIQRYIAVSFGFSFVDPRFSLSASRSSGTSTNTGTFGTDSQ